MSCRPAQVFSHLGVCSDQNFFPCPWCGQTQKIVPFSDGRRLNYRQCIQCHRGLCLQCGRRIGSYAHFTGDSCPIVPHGETLSTCGAATVGLLILLPLSVCLFPALSIYIAVMVAWRLTHFAANYAFNDEDLFIDSDVQELFCGLLLIFVGLFCVPLTFVCVFMVMMLALYHLLLSSVILLILSAFCNTNLPNIIDGIFAQSIYAMFYKKTKNAIV